MARRRRRRTSTIEDLVEITTRMPWWFGCLLAVLSYVILHYIAGIKPASPGGLGDIGSTMGKQMVVNFAMFGQIILPAVFGFGALLSLIRQPQQKKSSIAFEQPTPEAGNTRVFRHRTPLPPSPVPQSINDLFKNDINPIPPAPAPQEWSLPVLLSLEWKRFETVCAEFLRMVGYDPRETSTGADGGVDIWVYKSGSEKPVGIIQCKAWATYKVGVKPVRELFGVMASEGVAHGKFITSGKFTQEALEFAKDKKLELISGEAFLNWIGKLSPEKQKYLLEIALEGDYRTPTCPQCGVKMTIRQRRESNRKFWGCLQYPGCRATLVFKSHD